MHDVEPYLPMRDVKMMRNGKTVYDPRPLWPGWMFVNFDPLSAQWDVVHHRRLALGLLSHGERIVRFTEADIARARRLEAERCHSREARARWEYALGSLLRITDHPFASFTAKVTRRDWVRGEPRYVGTVDFFGRETLVEFDERQLVPA